MIRRQQLRTPKLLFAALPIALSLTACHYRYLERPQVPVVAIETIAGRELGVSTEDGVLFLGRSSSEGPAKVTYFLDRAPLVEAGMIRPFGASLMKVELDVDIPSVPIDFEMPRAGEELILMGIDDDSRWQVPVTVADDDRIQGSAVRVPASLKLAPRHIGAGVFRTQDGDLRLIGMVKAMAEASTGERWYLLAGPNELRRALLEPKDAVPTREIRYRADGTRTILRRR